MRLLERITPPFVCPSLAALKAASTLRPKLQKFFAIIITGRNHHYGSQTPARVIITRGSRLTSAANMAELSETLEHVFKQFDTDASGFIEDKEGLAIAHHMGASKKDGEGHAYPNNEECWSAMKKEMDTDGDGKISLQEFVDYMTKGGMTVDAAVALKNELLDKGVSPK